jgi:hypothetical protein
MTSYVGIVNYHVSLLWEVASHKGLYGLVYWCYQ